MYSKIYFNMLDPINTQTALPLSAVIETLAAPCEWVVSGGVRYQSILGSLLYAEVVF